MSSVTDSGLTTLPPSNICSFMIVQFLLKETIKVITKLNIIQYLSPHEKTHHRYHLCKIDTYLEKFLKWRMYHGVRNKRQSIEGKKLCSLAQCSAFCFQVCLKMRNPFLKFSFVLGNKAARLFRNLPLWMHCKAGKYNRDLNTLISSLKSQNICYLKSNIYLTREHYILFSPLKKEKLNWCCYLCHPGPTKEERDNCFLNVNYSCPLQARFLKQSAISTLRAERKHLF